MRAVLILLWVGLAVLLLLPLLRRLAAQARPASRELADELVKDPVCHTYVARSRAVRGEWRGAPVYFCSEACARRHAASG
jgi:YHS domain-containing protein